MKTKPQVKSIPADTALYVPTKDRPFFLGRMLRYYDASNFPSPIYVGDASVDEHQAEQNRQAVQRHPKLSVRYHRLAQGRRIHDALLDLLQIGTETMAVFIEDDSLVVPEGLYASCEFLAARPEYRCACGWGVSVFASDPVRLDGARIGAYPMGESEMDDPAARFERFFNGGLFLPYLAVHRRAEFVEDLAPVPECPDINFIEILINGLSVIRGKVKRLDRFFLVRPSPRPGEYGIPPAVEWITDARWRRAQACFEDALVRALVEKGVADVRARSLAREALYNYLTVRFASKAPPSLWAQGRARLKSWLAARTFSAPESFAPILQDWKNADRNQTPATSCLT